MKKFKKPLAILISISVIVSSFCLHAFAEIPDENSTEVAAFVAAMSEKPVLAPGSYDDLSDDSYAYKMVRSRDLPTVNGGLLSEDSYVRKITVPAYNPNGDSTISRMTQPIGQLFGIRANSAYTNINVSSGWSGNAVVYNVVEGSYIATMLVAPAWYNDYGYIPGHWNNYGFEVSSDGWTWDTVNPTFTNGGSWTAGVHQEVYTQATVQIPEGAKYYRITLPGYKKEATGNTLRVDGSWVPDTGVTAIESNETGLDVGGIGISVATSVESKDFKYVSQSGDFMDGDTNGDKVVDSVDFALLRKTLLDKNTEVFNPDVTGDGNVNILDLVSLKKKVVQ